MSSDSYAIAMKETLLYLEGIRTEDYNKIPKSLIQYLEENSDPDYVCDFDPYTPLAELNLHEETYGLLAMLYYKYWCKSDSERKYYLELLAKNVPPKINLKRCKVSLSVSANISTIGLPIAIILPNLG